MHLTGFWQFFVNDRDLKTLASKAEAEKAALR
jgi:hypothetical protein